jgi:hypothetical protein
MATVKTSAPAIRRSLPSPVKKTIAEPEDTDEGEGNESEQGEEIEVIGETRAITRIEYSAAELKAWNDMQDGAIERIPLEEVMIKANYGLTVVGNLIDRVELSNGPGKSKTNPEGLWYAYRIEAIRSIGPVIDGDTGEEIMVYPGGYCLIPETAKLAALARFVGSCIALRPKGQKPMKAGKNPMWLYEGVCLSRTPMAVETGL